MHIANRPPGAWSGFAAPTLPGRSELRARLGVPALAVAVGVVLGVGVVAASPLYLVGGLLGIVFILAVFRDPRVAIFGFVGVATLLPFAVIPIQLGVFKLTLVDVCLMSVLLVWALRLLGDRDESLRGSGVDFPVLLFIGICVVAFVLGTAYQVTASDARLFVKYLTSIALFFVTVNWVRDIRTLRRTVFALAIGGGLAAVIAILLYYTSEATATRLLGSLSHIGYPDSDILQYIASTKIQRAIGTSIDPNILGATLMMCATLAVGLLVVARRLAERALLIAALGFSLVALLLTYSRGSLIGFFVGAAVIATLRYRRLWLVGALLAIVFLLTGELGSSSFVAHLQSGIEVKDQAAAMRLGEYKDAFRLIQAYPWFGVGFGAAPDVDLYIGVSSIYLLIAENVGLVGLAIWTWAMGSILLRGLRHVLARTDENSTLVVACLASLVASLVAGIFDHHFADIQFPHVVALVWLLAGLAMAGIRLRQADVYSGGKEVSEVVR
jgi:O-antigen ligase